MCIIPDLLNKLNVSYQIYEGRIRLWQITPSFDTFEVDIHYDGTEESFSDSLYEYINSFENDSSTEVCKDYEWKLSSLEIIYDELEALKKWGYNFPQCKHYSYGRCRISSKSCYYTDYCYCRK